MRLGSPGANSLSALAISKFHLYLHFRNIINNLIFLPINAGRMGAILDKGGLNKQDALDLQLLLAKCVDQLRVSQRGGGEVEVGQRVGLAMLAPI